MLEILIAAIVAFFAVGFGILVYTGLMSKRGLRPPLLYVMTYDMCMT